MDCNIIKNHSKQFHKTRLLPKILLFLGVFASAASGVGGEYLLGKFFSFSSDGAFKVDGQKIVLTCWGPKWKNIRRQSQKTVTGTVNCTRKRFALNGLFQVNNGTFILKESAEELAPNRIRYRLALDNPNGITVKQLALELKINPSWTSLCPPRADSWKFAFGEKCDPKHWVKTKNKTRMLTLPLPSGTLTIKGNFSLWLQDERFFGKKTWSFRIGCAPSKGVITQAALELELTFTPIKSTGIDLRSAFNLAFADKIEGDSKGGWTDQGSANDMSCLPSGKLMCKGIQLEIVDPSKNKNSACLGMYNRRQSNLPRDVTVKIANPPKGRYLYVLHALAWPPKNGTLVGEISCALDSSEAVENQTITFPVVAGKDVADFWMPKALSNAVIGWKGTNKSSPVGLYMTRFDLTGEALKSIRFTSKGISNWLIVAATISDHRVTPKASQAVTITPGKNWIKLKPYPGTKPGSILDFSILADAPAGKHGFVRVNKDHFEFSDRPVPTVRFYGTNIVYWTHYMDKETTDNMARELAATGYNLLRLHMFDFRQAIFHENGEVKLKPDYQDKLDYLIYAMKQRGIYITLDVFGTRGISKGELSDYPDSKINHKDFKALIFASKSAMHNYKSFARNLFNHVNNYTKLAWKDEPAIASVSFINEGTLFSSAVRSKFVFDIYNKKFEAYLKEKKIVQTPQSRDFLWRKFLVETYLLGFVELRDFYKNELKLKVPLTDQNYSTSVALTVLRKQYDYVDNHFYWAHPVFPTGKFNSLPAIVMNTSSIGSYAGGVSAMFPSRIFGKPFTVSEWNHSAPNSFRAEGAFLTGAYAALQDWSALCRFAYAISPEELKKKEMKHSFFTIARDPLALLSERAGVLFFVRGDVTPSKICYPFLINENHLEIPENNDVYPLQIKWLGLIGKTGSLIGVPGKKNKLPRGTMDTLSTGSTWPGSLSCNQETPSETLLRMITTGKLPKGSFDPALECFQSSTGQLVLNRQNKTFQATTPYSEGFLLNHGQTLAGKFATVSAKSAFNTILIAAMDAAPLTTSKRILILHLTDTKNNAMRFSSEDMNSVEDTGTSEKLIRRGEAEIIINTNLDGYTLYAVGFDGARLKKIPLQIGGGKSRFIAKTDCASEPVPAYELVKE